MVNEHYLSSASVLALPSWSNHSLRGRLHDHTAVHAAATGIRRAIPFLTVEAQYV